MLKKQIRWVIIMTFTFFINLICNIFVKRDKNMYLFGARPKTMQKDMFCHNTKYLFMYIQKNHPEINAVWLCDDKGMRKELIKKGYKNIYPRFSLKGIYALLKAKYWFYDFKEYPITEFSCRITNAVGINLWHGIALKKINFDTQYKKNKIVEYCRMQDSYQITCSEYDSEIRKSAFRTNDEHIRLLGYPRCDAIVSDIENAEIFMEKDFHKLKNLKECGKKICIYMPTFRDTNIDVSGWLKSEELYEFLKKYNTILACKLHPYDVNQASITDNDYLYKLDNTTDVYPILKYTDALITDYSSVSFDYLLLDKPILYYSPDIEEYQETCRGFYTSYDEYTAGIVAKTEVELLNALNDTLSGIDNYKERRKILRDKHFKYQDRKNCERIVEFINSLNKKR